MEEYKVPQTPEEEIDEIEKLILHMVEIAPKFEINRGSIFDVVASKLIMLGKISDIKHTYTRESYCVKSVKDKQIIL